MKSREIKAKQIGIRFTDADLKVLTVLQAKTKLRTRTAVIRLAIRRLCYMLGI